MRKLQSSSSTEKETRAPPGVAPTEY